MSFGIPLAVKEKRHVVNQDVLCEVNGIQQISHGNMAKHLNNLFKSYNKGTRSRMTVYLFRRSVEYSDIKESVKGKEVTKINQFTNRAAQAV